MKRFYVIKMSQLIAVLTMGMKSPQLSSSAIDVEDYLSVRIANTHQDENINARVFAAISRELPAVSKLSAASLTRQILLASQHAEIDPLFLLAMIETESQFKLQAVGRHGEVGLLQIRPETAEWIARRSGVVWLGREALFDPSYNLRLSVEYIRYLKERFGDDTYGYLSAYNLGVRKVRMMFKANIRPAIYADRVMSNYRRLANTDIN